MTPPHAPKGAFKTAGSSVSSFTSWYQCTGEFREPKPGEFYLSGAIPEVYEMPIHITANSWKGGVSRHWIVRRIEDPPMEVVVGLFRYRLAGPA